MTNGACAFCVNVIFAVDVLFMRVNSHIICKMESKVFAVVVNDMTLCPNERYVQFKLFVHLFGCMRRHPVFSSFNCNMLSIIQYLAS